MFDPDYRGEVSIVLFSPTGVQRARVHMTWGRFQRDDEAVELFPGDLATNSGGTLWRAYKRDQGNPNPGMVVHSSVPVCVEFGTALDPPIAPSGTIDANQGWY
jgi:hypothetical protein